MVRPGIWLTRTWQTPPANSRVLAWMLEQSYGLVEEAKVLLGAINEAFRAGFRTNDLVEDGAWNLRPHSDARVVGTREFGQAVMARLGAVGAAG